MVKPAHRRELAHKVKMIYSVSIRVACDVLSISTTCYHYQAKLSDENEEIAGWLCGSLKLISAGDSGCAFYSYATIKALNGIISEFTVSTESWSLTFE